MLDEVGNTPLRELPELVSTLAGLGVQMVTIWQSVAQVKAKGVYVTVVDRGLTDTSAQDAYVSGDAFTKILADEQARTKDVLTAVGLVKS